MQLIIVSGMSGAGKSSALKILEDFGYFCVDNLPTPMLFHFAKLMHMPDAVSVKQAAIGIDIRGGLNPDELSRSFRQLDDSAYEYRILYLDSSNDVLMRRYKETRRTHPLDRTGSIENGIREERLRTAFLRERADYIIDTSALLIRDLRQQLEKIFINHEDFKNLMVTVSSFGYKYGLPTDADLVFDVRFLPNPYYIADLRNKTGNDEAVQNYVLQFSETHIFLEKICELIDFLLPNYMKEGKNSLVIAFGCTGGKHRSVTLANKLYAHLRQNRAIGVQLTHHDINRDSSAK